MSSLNKSQVSESKFNPSEFIEILLNGHISEEDIDKKLKWFSNEEKISLWKALEEETSSTETKLWEELTIFKRITNLSEDDKRCNLNKIISLFKLSLLKDSNNGIMEYLATMNSKFEGRVEEVSTNDFFSIRVVTTSDIYFFDFTLETFKIFCKQREEAWLPGSILDTNNVVSEVLSLGEDVSEMKVNWSVARDNLCEAEAVVMVLLKEIEIKKALAFSDLGPLEELWWTMEKNIDEKEEWLIVLKKDWKDILTCSQFIAMDNETFVVYHESDKNSVMAKLSDINKLTSDTIYWNLWKEEIWINPEMAQIATKIFEQGFTWKISCMEETGYFELFSTLNHCYRIFDRNWKLYSDINWNEEFDKVVNEDWNIVTVDWQTVFIKMENWNEIHCKDIEKTKGWEITYDVLIKYFEENHISWEIDKIFWYNPEEKWLCSFLINWWERIHIDNEWNEI